jgi:PPOX class probable F420-dependent enzyme
MEQVLPVALETIKAHRLFLTTYGPEGRSGTVPVWFMVHDGRIYFTTLRSSVKARRIRENPRVAVRFGSLKAPSFEARASWVEDLTIYTVILPVYRKKYWYLWWLMGRVIRRRWKGGDSTAIQISLGDV